MRNVPLDLLQISPLRPSAPLPWPPAAAVALARSVGFVDPVTVRPIAATWPQRYEILTGLKHWLLAQRAELPTIAVQVREPLSDAQAHQLIILDAGDAVAHPIDEARMIQTEVAQGKSITAAGRELGLSRTEASHRLRLLQLAPSVQALIAAGQLDMGKARALVGLTASVQLELVQRLAWEKLNTRQVEALAKVYKEHHRNTHINNSSLSAPSARDPNLTRLETDLTEKLGTPVTVTYGEQGRGQLVIDFDTLEILEGVLEKLGYAP
jgi:ParB family chromosome partitioning protein